MQRDGHLQPRHGHGVCALRVQRRVVLHELHHRCGVRHPHPLPIRRIAFGSFIAYALSHSLGFPLLSGGPVRYRFWSIWGLSTSEIAQAISFAGATFIIGMIAVAGFLRARPTLIQLLRLPFVAQTAGRICLRS